MLRSSRHFVTGLLGLFLLCIRYRGRFKNSYWQWRRETAFGQDASRSSGGVDRWWAILDFGAWVWQIRRM